MDIRSNPCRVHFNREVYTPYHNAWYSWLYSFSISMTVWLFWYGRLDLMRSAANKYYASVPWIPRFKSPTQFKGRFQPECYWLTDKDLFLTLLASIFLFCSITPSYTWERCPVKISPKQICGKRKIIPGNW